MMIQNGQIPTKLKEIKDILKSLLNSDDGISQEEIASELLPLLSSENHAEKKYGRLECRVMEHFLTSLIPQGQSCQTLSVLFPYMFELGTFSASALREVLPKSLQEEKSRQNINGFLISMVKAGFLEKHDIYYHLNEAKMGEVIDLNRFLMSPHYHDLMKKPDQLVAKMVSIITLAFQDLNLSASNSTIFKASHAILDIALESLLDAWDAKQATQSRQHVNQEQVMPPPSHLHQKIARRLNPRLFPQWICSRIKVRVIQLMQGYRPNTGAQLEIYFQYHRKMKVWGYFKKGRYEEMRLLRTLFQLLKGETPPVTQSATFSAPSKEDSGTLVPADNEQLADRKSHAEDPPQSMITPPPRPQPVQFKEPSNTSAIPPMHPPTLPPRANLREVLLAFISANEPTEKQIMEELQAQRYSQADIKTTLINLTNEGVIYQPTGRYALLV